MSFYDDASLIMYPSGYKADKIYSLKPTDGSGDLDFTRSNDTATRVNSAGLIEKVRTNLALYSEQFDNAYWSKYSSTITANTSETLDPLQGNAADIFVSANATASSGIEGNIVYTSGGEFTVSLFAKYKNTAFIQLLAPSFVSADFVNFNIQTGAIVGGNYALTPTITSVGNGWFRCLFTFVSNYTGTTSISPIFLIDSASATRGQAFTGNGVKSVYIFGAQAETGVATDYIPTTTNAVSVGMTADIPRIDYTGGGCGKLLLEPQRTNIITFSEQLDNAAWDTTEDLTIIANATTSPDGNINAENVIPDATLAFHRVKQTNTVSLSTPYTLSVYVKPNGYNFFLIRTNAGTSNNVGFDLTNGTITFAAPGYSGFISELGNGWYRLGYVASYDITTVEFGFRSQPTAQTDNTISQFTGDGTSGAFIWGAQLEQGSYATSYIPTLSAASTRGADAFSLANLQSNGILPQLNEGTLFFDLEVSGRRDSTAGFRHIRLADNSDSTSNRIRIYEGNNGVTSYIRVDLTADVIEEGFSANVENKLAVTWGVDGTKLFINGSLISSTATRLDFASNPQLLTSIVSNYNFNQILLFPTPLTDTQAIELTTL